MEQKEYAKYERAKKRVDAIKLFYGHVKVFVVINVLVVVGGILLKTQTDLISVEPRIENWIYWNMIIIPTIWGVVLLCHGIYVYKYQPKFLKEWEERKIQELMDSDKDN